MNLSNSLNVPFASGSSAIVTSSVVLSSLSTIALITSLPSLSGAVNVNDALPCEIVIFSVDNVLVAFNLTS